MDAADWCVFGSVRMRLWHQDNHKVRCDRCNATDDFIDHIVNRECDLYSPRNIINDARGSSGEANGEGYSW
jgi:hypothetical protein